MAKTTRQRQSDLFGYLPPDMAAVKSFGAEIGLPPVECEKFWFYHDARDWMLGKIKMLRWKSAVQTWRLMWMERGQQRSEAPKSGGGMDKVIRQREFERVLARISEIKGTYGQHQNWGDDDRAEYRKLVARREELKQILGVTI